VTYVLQDRRGWTLTTNSRNYAARWFKRLRAARGDMRLQLASVDGAIVWPVQADLFGAR